MKNNKDLKKIVGNSFEDMSIKDMTKVEGTGGAHADSEGVASAAALSASLVESAVYSADLASKVLK